MEEKKYKKRRERNLISALHSTMHVSLTHSSRLSGRLSFCRKKLIPVVKNAVSNLSLMSWQYRRQIRLHTITTGGHWLSNGCFISQELLPTICSKHVFSDFKQMNNSWWYPLTVVSIGFQFPERTCLVWHNGSFALLTKAFMLGYIIHYKSR